MWHVSSRSGVTTLQNGYTLVTVSYLLSVCCSDEDLCTDANFGCSHYCVQTPFGAMCACPPGMQLIDSRTCIGQLCRAFDCRILYGRYLPTAIVGLQRVKRVLIFFFLLLVFQAFIPGLKHSFSANPSHCSLFFSSSGLTTWIPQTVYCYF